MTSITQTQVQELESALASGGLQVRIGDRWITYRSVEELKAALDWAKGEISKSADGAASRATAYVATVDRGVG